jgi:hypothetical protein
VGGDGTRLRREAMLLVIALVCAAISAPIVLNSVDKPLGDRIELRARAVELRAGLFELDSEGRVDAVHFAGELVDAGVQQPDLSAEKCKTGNDHDRYGDD